MDRPDIANELQNSGTSTTKSFQLLGQSPQIPQGSNNRPTRLRLLYCCATGTTVYSQECSGAGTPFRQIFLSRNGAPVNTVDHIRQINSYYKKLPYTRNLANWFSGKSLKLLPPDVIILSLKCTKFDFGWGSAPDPAGGAYSAPPDPLAGLKGAYF